MEGVSHDFKGGMFQGLMYGFPKLRKVRFSKYFRNHSLLIGMHDHLEDLDLSLCKHNPLDITLVQRILEFKRPGLIFRGHLTDKDFVDDKVDELKKRFYLLDLRVITSTEQAKLPRLSRFFSIVEEDSSAGESSAEEDSDDKKEHDMSSYE